MEHHKEYLQELIKKGGPTPDDYYDLDAWIIEISDWVKTKQISKNELQELIKLFGDAFSTETMQGFAFQKPHGYAGDFEIIDRIYQRYISTTCHLTNWDKYLQTHSAVHFDCIEQDKNAISHAQSLCNKYLDKITFFQKNVLRFNTDKKYDLIWSAGLFDYFENNVFVFMLKRLSTMVTTDGKIVIGNFSTNNPSRPYMELFEWKLHHRSPQTLKAIAREAGFNNENIYIEKEETGVNLFLHLKV